MGYRAALPRGRLFSGAHSQEAAPARTIHNVARFYLVLDSSSETTDVNSFSRCPFYYLTLPKLEITSVG
jgi:hypothetical protein